MPTTSPNDNSNLPDEELMKLNELLSKQNEQLKKKIESDERDAMERAKRERESAELERKLKQKEKADKEAAAKQRAEENEQVLRDKKEREERRKQERAEKAEQIRENKQQREYARKQRQEAAAQKKADLEDAKRFKKALEQVKKEEELKTKEKEKSEKEAANRFQEFLENIENKLSGILNVRGTLNEGITSAFGSNIVTKALTTGIDAIGGLYDSLFEKPQEEEKDPLVEAIKQQSESIRELIESVKDAEPNTAIDRQTEAIEKLISSIDERGGLPNESERTSKENSVPIKSLEAIENYSEILEDILLELQKPKTDDQLADLVKQNTEILSSQSQTLDNILAALYGPNQLEHENLEKTVFESMADTLSGVGEEKSKSDTKASEIPGKTESADISDTPVEEKPRFKDSTEPVTDVKPKSIWDRIKSDALSVEKNVQGFKNLVKMMTNGLNKVYDKLEPIIRPITQVAKSLTAAIEPLTKHTDFVKAQIDKFKDIVGRKFLKADPSVVNESQKDILKSPTDAKPVDSGTSDNTNPESPIESKIPGMDIPDIDIDVPDGKKSDKSNKPGKSTDVPDLEQKSKPIPDGKKSAAGKMAQLGKSLLPWVGALAVTTGIASGVDYVLGETADIGKQEITKEQLDTDAANWDKMSSGEKIISGAARGIEKIGSLVGLDNISKEAQSTRIEKESEAISSKLNAIEEKQVELKEVQEAVVKQTTNNQMPTQVNNIVNNNNQSVIGSRMNSENSESSFMRYLKSVF